jgi:transmembrane sensor
MTGPTVDWEKLGRYLSGEASAEEIAAMRRWLDEHPSDAQAVAALDVATKHVKPAPIDVERALRRVKTRARVRTLSTYVTFAAAAVILIVAGITVVRREVHVVDSLASRQYSTGIGQRDSIVLGDGTRVLLGPASRIVVRGRSVQLQGEAYFKVAYYAHRPFTVTAGNVLIRDLATQFAVHSDSAQAVRVVVNEGAVQILARLHEFAILHAGDVALMQPDGRLETQRGAATNEDLAWTQGRLIFRDASMAELAADLRRWYGVELHVTDTALLRRHFTGSFQGEPIAHVLDVIGLALNAHVERRGDTAFMRSTAPIK